MYIYWNYNLFLYFRIIISVSPVNGEILWQIALLILSVVLYSSFLIVNVTTVILIIFSDLLSAISFCFQYL